MLKLVGSLGPFVLVLVVPFLIGLVAKSWKRAVAWTGLLLFALVTAPLLDPATRQAYFGWRPDAYFYLSIQYFFVTPLLIASVSHFLKVAMTRAESLGDTVGRKKIFTFFLDPDRLKELGPWRPGRSIVFALLPFLLLAHCSISVGGGDTLSAFHFKWITIEMEQIRYLLAAWISWAFGAAGFGVTAILALFSVIRYVAEYNIGTGIRMWIYGSLGHAGALLCVGLLFAQTNRFSELARSQAIGMPGALALATLGMVSLAAPTIFVPFGLGTSSSLVPLVAIASFCWGLSHAPLRGIVAAFIAVALTGTFLIILNGSSTVPPKYHYGIVLGGFPRALTFTWIALLGRGLRIATTAEGGNGALDRIAQWLVKPAPLVLSGIILLWCAYFRTQLDYGIFVLEQEFEGTTTGLPELKREFKYHPVTALLSIDRHLLPLVGLCIGAIYLTRGLWIAGLGYAGMTAALIGAYVTGFPPDLSIDLTSSMNFRVQRLDFDILKGPTFLLYACLGYILRRTGILGSGLTDAPARPAPSAIPLPP